MLRQSIRTGGETLRLHICRFSTSSASLGKQCSLRQARNKITAVSFRKEELRVYFVVMLQENCFQRSVWASDEHSDPKHTELNHSAHN